VVVVTSPHDEVHSDSGDAGDAVPLVDNTVTRLPLSTQATASWSAPKS